MSFHSHTPSALDNVLLIATPVVGKMGPGPQSKDPGGSVVLQHPPFPQPAQVLTCDGPSALGRLLWTSTQGILQTACALPALSPFADASPLPSWLSQPLLDLDLSNLQYCQSVLLECELLEGGSLALCAGEPSPPVT